MATDLASEAVRGSPADELTVDVVVEEPLGPGIDYDTGSLPPAAIHARQGGIWLGVDRAAVVDTDNGMGRALQALVAIPVSTFSGCRIRGILIGAFRHDRGLLVIAALPGAQVPMAPVLRAVGRVPDTAAWIAAAQARGEIASAVGRYRMRRSETRLAGGRAWQPPDNLPVELLRNVGTYSTAELQLERLPPRFLRGLRSLLDHDERLLFAVGRPYRPPTWRTMRGRSRGSREALLVLTDRQLIWLVDHADPDRYLFDWGIDADLIALEQLGGIELGPSGGDLAIVVAARSGEALDLRLPGELRPEAETLVRLARRFICPVGGRLLIRTYPTAVVEEPDWEDLYHQGESVHRLRSGLVEAIGPEIAAFAYSPSRHGYRDPVAAAVTAEHVGILGRASFSVPLDSIASVRVELSALACGLHVRTVDGSTGTAFPGPLADHIASVARVLRRSWASAYFRG